MLATASPLAFDPATHSYTLGGLPVPSVTQVLKQTGYIRLDGIPEPVLERARDRGDRIHKALHYLFDDDLDEDTIDPAIAGYIRSAQAFLSSYIDLQLRAEMRVWSERHHFAGTLDLLALDCSGRLMIGDFKTGEPADVAADLQLAAYQGALLEMRAVDPDLRRLVDRPVHRCSIRLFADGRFPVLTPYEEISDFSRFLNALHVVHHQRRRPEPSMAWDDER
jgi:hypothetical protein